MAITRGQRDQFSKTLRSGRRIASQPVVAIYPFLTVADRPRAISMIKGTSPRSANAATDLFRHDTRHSTPGVTAYRNGLTFSGQRAEDTSQCSSTCSLESVGDPAIHISRAKEWLEPHARRYCYLHGQEEMLLSFHPSWIRAEEVKVPRGESKLDKKIKQYRTAPWELRPDLRCNQMNCDASTWKQVDTPLSYTKLDGETLYEIRWRPVWTPFSDIKDLGRAKALLEARCLQRNVRKSTRVRENMEYRLRKQGEIAKVVQLERFLEA
ncbi:hypothetical protein BBP40_007919 [Aspergillus hancockii]|nr:hypothetical protein BBP40_007919 [Aspergillus hancockii]